MSNNNEFTNRKIDDLEKKLQGLFKNQDSKIFELKIENNKLINEIYKKFDEEINPLKYYNKLIINKIENNQNKFKIIDNKINYIEEFIRQL